MNNKMASQKAHLKVVIQVSRALKGVPCIVNIYPFYGDDPVKAEGGGERERERERESEHGTRELPSDNKVGSSGEKEGKRKEER